MSPPTAAPRTAPVALLGAAVCGSACPASCGICFFHRLPVTACTARSIHPACFCLALLGAGCINAWLRCRTAALVASSSLAAASLRVSFILSLRCCACIVSQFYLLCLSCLSLFSSGAVSLGAESSTPIHLLRIASCPSLAVLSLFSPSRVLLSAAPW